MQHIYAYQRCRQANYELAFEYIKNTFSPDLNSMEVQDPEELARRREQATQLLRARLEGRLLSGKGGPTIDQTVSESMRVYQEQCQKDQRFLRKQMVARTEKISDYYLRFLLLPVVLRDEAGRDAQKKTVASQHPTAHQAPANLLANRLLLALKDDDTLQQLVSKQQVSWEAYRSEVRQLLKLVRADPQYQAYQAVEKPTLEEDVAIIRYVINTLALNSEAIINIFEEEGVNWEEDKKVIKSLTNRTFKSWEKGKGSRVEIASLTPQLGR